MAIINKKFYKGESDYSDGSVVSVQISADGSQEISC